MNVMARRGNPQRNGGRRSDLWHRKLKEVQERPPREPDPEPQLVVFKGNIMDLTDKVYEYSKRKWRK